MHPATGVGDTCRCPSPVSWGGYMNAQTPSHEPQSISWLSGVQSVPLITPLLC